MKTIQLSTSKLVCGYSLQKPLFKPLDLTLAAGEITAIMGGNGQGKTTLMQTLLGGLSPISGKITRYGKVGFVPQKFHSPFPYQVLDIVLMGRANQIGLFSMPSKQDKYLAHHALTQLQIDHLAKRPFDQLSGGQQQLVLIARALVSECQVLILDEPVTALDLAHQSTVLNLLKSLATDQNMSILFSTHEPTHAQLIAQHSLLLMGDGLSLYGPNHDVLNETNLSRLYGVPIHTCKLNREHLQYTTFIPVLTTSQ
ncbi:MAG: putative ABC transporter ATP-binding protein [Candidatus Celerinatantimonas neptuna]|nr:MAG: putative ABC transporter ATP-binding protein [Candidatus Celerinatantimonas neptuna]